MSQPVLERPGPRRRSVAALAAAALVASGAGLVPAAAAGAVTPTAGALAQMFSGTLRSAGGPVDVASLPGLVTAQAVSGAPGTVLAPISGATLASPLGALSTGQSLLGGTGIVNAGAVNQVAQALSDGSALSAVGAVTDAGALGGVANPTSVDLGPLLSAVPALQSGLTRLELTFDSIAATATRTAAGLQSGAFSVTGGHLLFANPGLTALPATVTTALAPLQQALDGLGGSGGGLVSAVDGIPVVGTALGLLGGLTGVTQSATVTATLSNAVSTLLTTVAHSPDGSVSFDPVTGLFTADLAQLAGGNLSALPAGTSLLSPALLSALTTQVTGLVSSLVGSLTSAVTAAIAAAPAHVSVLSVVPGLLGLDVQGTLAQITGGSASTSILGVLLSPTTLLSALAVPISGLTGGTNNPLSVFTSALHAGSTTPASGVLSTALGAVGSLVGVDLNEQTTWTNGVFTQIAMILTLLPVDTSPLTSLVLGSASVGPTAPSPVAPTASALAPARGPLGGGQTVTVTGTNFVGGLTSVTVGGTAVPASQVHVASPTQLSFTTPAHAVGAVAVAVQNATGSSAPRTYTYLPRPAVGALYPASGPAAGGKVMTVTGSGFVAGATSVRFGSTTVPAGSVTVSGTTRLTLRTPRRVAGSVALTVTTPGGTSTGRAYLFRAAPAITSLSQTRGVTGGGRSLTVLGARFVPGQTEVYFAGSLVRASSVRVTSSTSLVVTTPARGAGTFTVTVTTPGGVSNGKAYRYVRGAGPSPRESRLSVTRGSTAGGVRVVVTGSGFVPLTSSVRVGSTVVPAALVTVTSPTSLWFLAPARPAGAVSVRVVNGRLASAARGFRYVAPSAPLSAAPAIGSPRTGASTPLPAPFVTGSGTVGAAVTVTVDGLPYCRATVGGNRAWACAGSVPLLRGRHYVGAVQQAAGRSVSRRSGPVWLTVG